MRGVGYCCALCRLPIGPSARPAPVTTLQPTMSNGSNGCVSCVHFLGSSGTVKFYEYMDWLASWTRPADVFPSFGMYFMGNIRKCHYSDNIMRMMASQFTGVSMVCATVWPGADQRKHQSSESLEFVGNSPVTIEFLSERANDAENVSIQWRYHATLGNRDFRTVCLACLGRWHIASTAGSGVIQNCVTMRTKSSCCPGVQGGVSKTLMSS